MEAGTQQNPAQAVAVSSLLPTIHYQIILNSSREGNGIYNYVFIEAGEDGWMDDERTGKRCWWLPVCALRMRLVGRVGWMGKRVGFRNHTEFDIVSAMPPAAAVACAFGILSPCRGGRVWWLADVDQTRHLKRHLEASSSSSSSCSSTKRENDEERSNSISHLIQFQTHEIQTPSGRDG